MKFEVNEPMQHILITLIIVVGIAVVICFKVVYG